MSDWNAIAVLPEIPLEQAIAVLDEGGLRIVLVVDEHGVLLGTLTDGDIRRALIKHQPMNTFVENVMCTTPKVGQLSWTKKQIRAAMEASRLLQLPIVDEQRHVVRIEILHDLLDKKTVDNPVFLMAGGFGKRLYPLTKDCPKPLLKIGGKPILELILESLVDAGFHDFYISTHYLPKMIRDHFGDGSRWGISIRYIHEENPLGTAGALGLLPQQEIRLPFLMMNGDLLTKVDYLSLLDSHIHSGSIATMGVREYEYQVPYGVVQSKNNVITGIDEKPTQRFFINAGIYLLSPELLAKIEPGVAIDMPTLLQNEMEKGGLVTMFPIHEYWIDIGQIDDFNRAQQDEGVF